MFAPLLGVVRADLDRQLDWARKEARRQLRYAVLTSAIIGMAVLAALGALIVGLIALQSWLAPQIGSLAALGAIGGGLLVLTLVLLLVAFSLRRPGLKARPALKVAQPVALFRTGSKLTANPAITADKDSLRFATEALREGTRAELVGALALIALAGVVAGRRLRRPQK